MNFLTNSTAALALCATLAVMPDSAEACDQSECSYADVWTSLEPLNAALIPIDGVLLLQATSVSGSSFLPDTLTLDVTLDGQPVAGALENIGGLTAFAWRPEQPLAAGATYKVNGTIDNPDDLDYCGEDLTLDFEFKVDDKPSAPLKIPVVTPTEKVVITGDYGLEALVCCEGVEPKIVTEECGEATGFYLTYPEGACAAGTGVAGLDVVLEVTPPPEPATASLLKYELIAYDMLVRVGLSPTLA